MIAPPYLQEEDKVAIVCPASKLPAPIWNAVELFQSWRLQVVLGKSVEASFHRFSGEDDLRAADLQRFLDDPAIKAVIAARGGYGTIRILDKIDFTGFMHAPKWIVGFSDITLLHQHVFTYCGVQSIHGQMPYTFPGASYASLESLRNALFGKEISYRFLSGCFNRTGEATGYLMGGHLTLLTAALGSVSEPDYNNKILFLECVDEPLYAIDRMILTLKRAGKLARLAGLMVGKFTNIQDEDIPFGLSVHGIISEAVSEYQYPVCYDFPAGHVPDNRSMIFGRRLYLHVVNDETVAAYLPD
ncbi:MAG: LD-carboxypeptidase [Chitinophagaceae bacterium]|nr:LD-carboxypeptidase [Chitinophagaceae bacterium]